MKVVDYVPMGSHYLNHTIVDEVNDLRVSLAEQGDKLPAPVKIQALKHIIALETILTPWFPRVLLDPKKLGITQKDD